MRTRNIPIISFRAWPSPLGTLAAMLVKKLISSRNNEETSVDDGGCFQKVLNLDVDVFLRPVDTALIMINNLM